MPIGVLAIETVSSEVPNKQLLGQELVTGLIKARIAEDQSLAFNIVMQGLADFPDEVVAIVISAMQTGASTIDIASQCETDIPTTDILNSVTGETPQDVDPDPRIAGCQCATLFDQTLNMLVEAMKNAESIQLKALLLDITIKMIPSNGVAGSTILVNTLAEGDFLSYAIASEDCTAECTRPLAQNLVNQKTQATNTSLVVDPDPSEMKSSASDS